MVLEYWRLTPLKKAIIRHSGLFVWVLKCVCLSHDVTCALRYRRCLNIAVQIGLQKLVHSHRAVSLECRKTKTKVITLANHKKRRAIHCPIKTPSNCRKRGKTRASYSRLALVLVVISLENGASFSSQALSLVMQNQSKRKLLSTVKWNSLYTQGMILFIIVACLMLCEHEWWIPMLELGI